MVRVELRVPESLRGLNSFVSRKPASFFHNSQDPGWETGDMSVVPPGAGQVTVAQGTSAQPFVLKDCLILESGATSGIFSSPLLQTVLPELKQEVESVSSVAIWRVGVNTGNS